MEDTFDEILVGNEPELESIQQVEVPFLDAFIMALLGSDGDIYVPIVPFATHLGIGKPSNQVARIKRDDTMSEGLRMMIVDGKGGHQRTQCIRLDMFTIWLVTITEKMCDEKIRLTLSQYKKQVARLILRHFQERALIRTAGDSVPVLQPDASLEQKASYHRALAEMYDEQARQHIMIVAQAARLGQVEDELAGMRDDLSSVQETLAIMGEMVREVRISPEQANQIQALVSKIHDATSIHQATIFAKFKTQWQIPRYDELLAHRFDAAFEWLRQWGWARISPQQRSTQPPLW